MDIQETNRGVAAENAIAIKSFLSDLKVEDEVDYMVAMRAITLIGLLQNSFQGWYDVMLFDICLEKVLDKLNHELLKEAIKFYYRFVVSRIAPACFGHDAYELIHDIAQFGVCPLCGRNGNG